MADAGLLSVKITADDAQLLAALARARSAVKQTSDQINSGLDSIKKYGAAFTAFATGAAAIYIHQTSEMIDAQAKLARNTGGTTAAIQALARAGDLAGVSQEDLAAAAGKLNVTLGKALEGTGPAVGALNALGLSAKKLSEMDTDQRFAAIADAIKNAGITAEQTSAILRDLGIKQQSIQSLIEDGGGAIRDARKEVESFGIAVSEIDAAKIEAGNDAMTSIGLTARGVATQISIQLAPVLQEIGTRFHDAAEGSNGFRDTVIPAMQAIAKAVAYVGDSIQGLNMLWLLVKSGAEYAVADILTLLATIPLEISKQIDFVINDINLLIAAANKVGNLNIPPLKLTADTDTVKAINGTIEQVKETARETEKQLEEMASQTLPSDKVDEFFAAVQKRANDAAVAVVDSRKKMTEPVVLDTKDPQKKQDQHDKGAEQIASMRAGALPAEEKAVAELQLKYQKLNEIIAQNPELQVQAAEAAAALAGEYQRGIDTQIAAGQEANRAFLDQMTERVKAIEDQNLTEIEMAQKKYDDDQEMLDTALLNGVITQQKYLDISAGQQKAHEDNMRNMKINNWEDLKNLNKLSWQAQLSTVTGTLASITAQMSTKNRTMFEINKQAAAANAAMRIPSMMAGAYDAMIGIPYVGPVVAAAAAIAAGAFGAAQVAAIESTSYGSSSKTASSGVPSASGSTGAVDPSTTAQSGQPTPQHQKLSVEGLDGNALFSGDMVKALANKLLDYQKDGGVVVLQ